MAIQTVKTGAAVNDGTGDDARTAFTKINQNFTDSTNAASRLVGKSANDVPQVSSLMELVTASRPTTIATSLNVDLTGFYFAAPTTTGSPPQQYANVLSMNGYGSSQIQFALPYNDPNHNFYIRSRINANQWDNPLSRPWAKIYHSENTTKDSNGFIKAASPIVRLFADKIEMNNEAEEQGITFEKLGVGDYLVKGSLGFAQEGWYIEMPKDANGNVLVAVVYEQLANNDISVKTYAKKFDEETGDVVANTTKPRDIPATRWIDLRLQALPQTNPQPFNTDETVATDAE